MVLHDKSELKRRVRALVKRVKAVDVYAPVRWTDGAWGVDAMLRAWMTPEETQRMEESFQARCVHGLPLEKGAVEMFAALEAMEMPLMDLQMARVKENTLGREGYAQLAIDRAGLDGVFTPVALEEAAEITAQLRAFSGVKPLLHLTAADAPAQRYGTQYADCAKRAQACLAQTGIGGVLLEGNDEAMLRLCAAPLCEDANAVLHVRMGAQMAECVLQVQRDFPKLRMIVDLSNDEASLYAAGKSEKALPCVRPEGLMQAMALRGTALVPFASSAVQPGQLIGRWQQARVEIAQQLTQTLLPLARTGYALHSEDIEQHIAALMGGNVRALYE